MIDAVRQLNDNLLKTSDMKGKKSLISAFFANSNKLNMRKVCSDLESDSDKMLFLTLLEHHLRRTGPLNSLNIFLLKGQVQLQLNRQAKSAITILTARERSGKTFDDLIYETLVPFSIKNEYTILDEIINAFRYSGFSVFKINADTIQAVVKVIRYIREMKDEPIREEELKLQLSRIDFLDERFQTIFLAFIREDPFFRKYLESVKAFLTSREMTPEAKQVEKTHLDQLHFKELKNTKDLDHFSELSEKLLDSCKDYVILITEQFRLLLNEPLVNIYKLLRFPSNRDLFQKWIQEAPVPLKESKGIELKIKEILKGIKERYSELKAPKNEDELFTIFYDFNIDSTLKYKLLHNTAEGSHVDPQLQSLTLYLIKTVQYNTEKKFLETEVTAIKQSANFKKVLERFAVRDQQLSKQLTLYKEKFKKHLALICRDLSEEANKFFTLIAKQVVEEKLIPAPMLLQGWRMLRETKSFDVILKMANYLINFYITINCRLIIQFWSEYIKSAKTTDGIFIKRLLSSETKESIYKLCCSYSDEEALKTKLTELFNRGVNELNIREANLDELAAHTREKKKILSGKFQVSVEKQGTDFAVIVTDEAGAIKYYKEEKFINSFYDLRQLVQHYKVKAIQDITDRQWKILYQTAFVNGIKSLQEYIKGHLGLLYLEERLSAHTSDEIRKTFKEHKNRADYMESLRTMGQKELHLHERRIVELKAEQLHKERLPEPAAKRITAELTDEWDKVKLIKNLLKFIDALEEKTQSLIKPEESAAMAMEASFPEMKSFIPEEDPLPPLEEGDFVFLDMEAERKSSIQKDIPLIDINDIEKNLETIDQPQVEVTLMNCRASENSRLMDTLKQALMKRLTGKPEEAPTEGLEKLSDYVVSLPEVVELKLKESIIDVEGDNPLVIFNTLKQVAESFPRAERHRLIKHTIRQVKEEIGIREAYVNDRERNEELAISILYYNKEIEFQKKYISALTQYISYLQFELVKYEEQ